MTTPNQNEWEDEFNKGVEAGLRKSLSLIPEAKSKGDGKYIDTDTLAFYQDGMADGFNQARQQIKSAIEGELNGK